MAIWQDLVSDHGFCGRYASVRRFVVRLRGPQTPEAHWIIVTPPGEEAQVDYGEELSIRISRTPRTRPAPTSPAMTTCTAGMTARLKVTWTARSAAMTLATTPGPVAPASWGTLLARMDRVVGYSVARTMSRVGPPTVRRASSR